MRLSIIHHQGMRYEMKPHRRQEEKCGSRMRLAVAGKAGRFISTDSRFEVAMDCSQSSPLPAQHRKLLPGRDGLFPDEEKLLPERASSLRSGIAAPGRENQLRSINESGWEEKIFSR